MNLIDEYHRAFPGVRLTIFQMELIEAEVQDERAWSKAVTWWAGNGYRPQSIFKIIDYYKGILNGTNQSFTDRTKVAAQVGKYVPDDKPFIPDPPCRFCGQEICLSTHADERLAEMRI